MNKLQKILNAFPDSTSVDFKDFDQQVNVLKSNLKEKIQVKTVGDVQNQLDKFNKKIDFEPLLKSISDLKEAFNTSSEEVKSQLEEKQKNLLEIILQGQGDSSDAQNNLTQEIEALQTRLTALDFQRGLQADNLAKEIKNIKDTSEEADKMMQGLATKIASNETDTTINKEMADQALEQLESLIETVRKDLLNRVNNIGGGSMNRQIFIGGANPLTRYTDINFKAGSNVTITYANNDTTKKVDITISATGGGGGGGIVRSVNTVAISTAAGSTSGTDYVYLASGTITITLPTSVGNSNLYTIKNIGAGTVTVNTTGGETIDGGTTVTMPVQFTSVDLISNNSGNWDVT